MTLTSDSGDMTSVTLDTVTGMVTQPSIEVEPEFTVDTQMLQHEDTITEDDDSDNVEMVIHDERVLVRSACIICN